MVKVYIDEDFLKGYIPKLDDLLWNGQTNFDSQKSLMEIEVMNDFIDRGLKAVYLRNDIILRNSGTVIDSTTSESVSLKDLISRQRFVVNCQSLAGLPKTITLSGSNTGEGTFNTVAELTISQTGIQSTVITSLYNYYKVSCATDTAIDYEAFLTETSYDLLHAYKWICIILNPLATGENNPYKDLLTMFEKKYSEKWDTLKIFYDINETGNVETLEEANTWQINLMR
jgi:hypothetical protein